MRVVRLQKLLHEESSNANKHARVGQKESVALRWLGPQACPLLAAPARTPVGDGQAGHPVLAPPTVLPHATFVETKSETKKL